MLRFVLAERGQNGDQLHGTCARNRTTKVDEEYYYGAQRIRSVLVVCVRIQRAERMQHRMIRTKVAVMVKL